MCNITPSSQLFFISSIFKHTQFPGVTHFLPLHIAPRPSCFLSAHSLSLPLNSGTAE